jgi:hypothetical protein
MDVPSMKPTSRCTCSLHILRRPHSGPSSS